MAKVKEALGAGNAHRGWMVYCQGCGWPHVYDSDRWSFNNNLEKPTFKPSYLLKKPNTNYVCHSFVTDGEIKFLNDCTHEFAGQTIDLEEFQWGPDEPPSDTVEP